MSAQAVRLRDIAPRIGRARDGLLEDWRRERAGRMHHQRLLLAAERLVAHRELQLVRALNTRKGRYIVERQRKLDSALRQLRQLERTAA